MNNSNEEEENQEIKNNRIETGLPCLRLNLKSRIEEDVIWKTKTEGAIIVKEMVI